jgi:hypothetical protein
MSVVKRFFTLIDNINARKSRIVKRPLGLTEDRTIPGTNNDIKIAGLFSWDPNLMTKNVVNRSNPAANGTSCHKVIPIAPTSGDDTRRAEDTKAILGEEMTNASLVTE